MWADMERDGDGAQGRNSSKEDKWPRKLVIDGQMDNNVDLE